jgi:hypothetical protein
VVSSYAPSTGYVLRDVDDYRHQAEVSNVCTAPLDAASTPLLFSAERIGCRIVSLSG